MTNSKPLIGSADRAEEFHDDIIYPATIPFVLVHLACFAAIWTGVTLEAVLIGVALYWVRMFGLTGGYHRYFSHRSYKTSRVGQFLLGVLAQSGMQRGVLWWSATHRHHHKHSDTELDVHSPRHRGFFYSHVGWIFTPRANDVDYSTVSDLAAYPELRWLDRHPYLVSVLLAVGCFLAAGWSGLIVGFFWSTVALFHGSVAINSLAHVHGKQRYVTGDDSRNNWWLALFTMGEGWHNNHHAYQSSTRQGFYWWEIDLTYYVLKVLSWFRIVWDLRAPPAEVVRNERRLGRLVVEQVAHNVAASVPVDTLAQQLRAAWAHTPNLDQLKQRASTAAASARDSAHARASAAQARAGAAVEQLQARLASMHLPHLPTADELRRRAQAMYDNLPEVSLDDVVERARQIVLEALSVKLLDPEIA